MSADNMAKRALFAGNKTALAKATGIPVRTLYNRRLKPGRITLDELAGLVMAQGIEADELYNLIKARW